ncbi:VWA domain-containing protein [Thiomicrorhabdus cannonii]|uniref:VWA domain-containing protein n=1 Tax=Thiomicrorhabdus cannonii TaxID=2748011 RepID=UPI0015BCEF08|nr:VWA domain-containing protein [Thiomicrorhabdus cannonii]
MQTLAFWQNFEFLWPWLAAFLPLPWLVKLLFKPLPQSQKPLLAPQIVQRVAATFSHAPTQHTASRKTRIPLILTLIWLLFMLAAMRPVWYLSPTPFSASGKELLLAVDLSGSMQKNDMQLGGRDVDRLTAVKSVVADFIRQRQGDRMGLILFGSQAFTQSPLTHDLNTVQTLLDEAEIGMAGNNTAIGDAIGLALKQSAHHPKLVLILLTDGTNTDGVDPLEAAQQAQQQGLKIYTIGVGQTRAPHGLDAFLGNSKADMDIATLRRIAELTQGQFFLANDTTELQTIYAAINRLESSEHEVHSYRLQSEFYVWPLGLAFVLSLLLAGWRLYRAGGL